jgi:multidrug efflux pump
MRRPPPTIVECGHSHPTKGEEDRWSWQGFSMVSPHPNIRHAGGRTISLSQFATFEYEQEFPLIWRRDRVPSLTVQADVVSGALPETVINSFSSAVDALAKSLPPSYHIVVAARWRRASVIAVVPVMLLIMLTVPMVQLHSFQPLFLSVAPLGLIGVVGGLVLSGRPLGSSRFLTSSRCSA